MAPNNTRTISHMPERPLQNILVGNVNMIQGSPTTMSSIAPGQSHNCLSRMSQDYVYVKRQCKCTWQKIRHIKIGYCYITRYYTLCKYIYICMNRLKNEKIISTISNLQSKYYSKVDVQKVNLHTKGKWLIHATKQRKVSVSEEIQRTGRWSCHNKTKQYIIVYISYMIYCIITRIWSFNHTNTNHHMHIL